MCDTQMGLANFAETLQGIQCCGIYNNATVISGAQIGLVNISREVHGFQFGLVNVADEIHGVQIGIVNYGLCLLFLIRYSIFQPSLFETLQSQCAALAPPARLFAVLVAAPGEVERRLELDSLLNDSGFVHMYERRDDLDSGFRPCSLFYGAVECLVECLPAVGIARAVLLHGSYEYLCRSDDLCP